jgi:hypothetical protein
MAFDFNARKSAAIFAVVGIIFGGAASYCAISGERSGTTSAIDPIMSDPGTPILRDSSPREFRHANNVYWAVGVFGFGVGAVGIYYFLKLRDCD